MITEQQELDVLSDMELIARGEELEMPWHRVRVLLDHGFAKINHPVITAGSRTSLGLTDKGLLFMDSAIAVSNSEERA